MEKIKFKYHPNVWSLGIISRKDEGEICQCCGNKTEYFLDHMYCKEDVNCICLECIASGRAAEKYNGTFISDAEFGKVNDEQKIEELTKRTPGYISWQGEYWLACCNDFVNMSEKLESTICTRWELRNK